MRGSRPVVKGFHWHTMGVLAGGALVIWLWLHFTSQGQAPLRVPGMAPKPPPAAAGKNPNPGTHIPGPGQPGSRPGTWPQFRGADRMNRAPGANLERLLAPGGTKPLWSAKVCEGYAGPVINAGRVYLTDYDREKKEDVIRCLSLADGREIWRYTYHVRVKMNHGITRTTPVVTDRYLVSLGPKCHLVCLDAVTGKLVWKRDLVRENGTTVPAWYAGQCPLLDGDLVVIAPGGKPLLMGLELATGKPRWETPNPADWGMTHSSVVKMNFAGQDQYVYCHTRGVVGVAVTDGKILWNHPGWKISIANVPTPIPFADGRIFLCGGYNAGAVMLRLGATGETITVKEEFRLGPKVFGSDQQTPVLYEGHIYGVIPGGRLACLDPAGKQLWATGSHLDFELGFYMLVGDTLLVFAGKTGMLHYVDPSPEGYRERAKVQALKGHEIWAPMALVPGRLLVRNMTSLICLDITD